MLGGRQNSSFFARSPRSPCSPRSLVAVVVLVGSSCAVASCRADDPADERATIETVRARCVETTASRSVSLKVMTLNLRHDADEWQRRMELVADEIVRLDPDVIGLQEVAVEARQLEVLGELVVARGHARYETHQREKRTFFGTRLDEAAAVMSRWPIAERHQRQLVEERVAVLARVAHPSGGMIDVLDTHLENRRDPYYDDVRVDQIAEALALASGLEGCNPTVLTGDLNSTSTEPAYAAVVREGFVDSYLAVNGPVATAAEGNTAIIRLREGAFVQSPGRRIDYVFARGVGERTITAVASSVCFENHDAKGFYPSDHLGVMTTFTVRL